jgi:hypothetical protein
VLCFVVPHVDGHDFHDGAGFFYARCHFCGCVYGWSVVSNARPGESEQLMADKETAPLVTIYRDSALSLSHRTAARPPDHTRHTARHIMAAGKAATSQLACSWQKANPLGTSGRHFLHASGTRMAQLRLPVVPFVSCSSAPVVEKLHA